MRYFFVGTVLLFGVIGFLGWMRRDRAPEPPQVEEIALGTSTAPVPLPPVYSGATDIPEVDHISKLFDLRSDKLPIVETISFTSRVPWLKDRPAWIADYATHYQTSRHFIARSLNKKLDYFTQKVSPGDQFNVFKRDKNLRFHLLVDLARSRMLLYYFDLDAGERGLLKTYKVGLGKADSHRSSGFLTPIGKYELGEKVAIYKPGVMGLFQDEKVEMLRIFGTRWIPFGTEVEGCSEPAKGYGIHGCPWMEVANGQLIEDCSRIGKYESDGCIRLCAADMEELFAIVITKPTTVEIVKDYKLAKLPYVERHFP